MEENMNAIAKTENNLPDNVVPASSLMEIISRAASDPNTDVAKLERLMAIAEHHPEQLYARNRGLLKMSSAQLHDFAATTETRLPQYVKHSKRKQATRTSSGNRYDDLHKGR